MQLRLLESIITSDFFLIEKNVKKIAFFSKRVLFASFQQYIQVILELLHVFLNIEKIKTFYFLNLIQTNLIFSFFKKLFV